ncbi:MAG: Alpha/beta hydrolase family protein [Bacteroidetes bacterium]|nr:Alpha/beta hydrolase family protein [Bacteroidota bacterium]
MIKLRYSSLIFGFILAGFMGRAQDEPVKDPYIILSKKFIGAVKRNEPWKNYKFFDTTFYGKMIEDQTLKSIEQFTMANGPIVAIEKTECDTQGCKMATATAIKVAKGKYLWYQYFDQGQRIQRFAVDTFNKEQWFYKKEALENTNFTRKEVLVETSAFIKLPGSLYLPTTGAKKSPLVIFVHGSGPQDRNLSVGKNKVFLDMALQLVQKGVAVLIYDKRTYVYQYRDPFPMDSMDYNTETVDDAVAAFQYAKSFKEIDTNRIFVAGHSQGAMCAPLIAKKCKGMRGLILLAAPGRSLLEMIPEQLDYVATTQTKNKEQFEKMSGQIKWMVKNAQALDLNLKSKTMLPFGGKPKYWLFDRNYKALEEAKTLTIPTILLQGGRDYNVTKKDFDLWNAAMAGKSNFKSVWYEELDHMFFEGQGTARPQDVEIPKHVSKKVTAKMLEFIAVK